MQQRRAERKTADTISDVGESAREAANGARLSATNGINGMRELQLALISAAQENINAWFEYSQDALQARSMHDLVEVTTSHSRRQLQMTAEHARELAERAQKIARNTATPMASLFGSLNESR